MANTLNINRSHIVLVICLPVAILIGYLLADPMQFSNQSLIALLFGVLSLPLLMKWYHPLLIFSCNAIFVFSFLPGAPALWMVAAITGFFFAVINRCVDWQRRLMVGGNISRSLLLLGVVVFVTAYFRGGAGIAALGGSSFGGKRYICIAIAIMAFFALVSQPVLPRQQRFYALLFFVSGATSLLSLLVDFGGSKFEFLTLIVSSSGDGMPVDMSTVRLAGLGGICSAGLFYLLIRYGLRGILSNFWYLAFVMLFFAGTLLTGYRSAFGFVALVYIVAFFLEGLHRTRYLLLGGVIGMLCLIALLLFSDRLPWQIQRSISFLPVRINPLVKQDAQSSVDWRVEMWKVVMPQVPQYFWEGKGYALDPGDMYMSQVNSYTKLAADSSEWAVYAGDYHNGPLSLIIPFGIWGVMAFAWFLWAAGRMLYLNYVYGNAELKIINGVFLAYFITKVIFFLFLVGGFFGDLICFTSIAGLAISINGDRTRPVEQEITPIFTLATQRIAKDL